MPNLMIMLISALLFNLITREIFSDYIDGISQLAFPNFIVPEYMDIRSLIHYDFMAFCFRKCVGFLENGHACKCHNFWSLPSAFSVAIAVNYHK